MGRTGAHLGGDQISTGERNFCKHCGTALWLYDPTWPDLVHPHAGAARMQMRFSLQARTPDRDAIDTIVPVTHGCAAALLAGDALALPVLDYEHDGPDATGAAFDAAADPFALSFTPRLPLG